MGSALYWMGADVHGPHYGWSMCQALVMLLVPDKKHTIHNNSHHKAGRQQQLTPEVTLICTHIVSKFQPNPTIIAKVINNLVHRNFFQDHCLVSCIKIKPYSTFLSRPSIFVYFPFKTITFSLILVQWHRDSSYSNHPCLTGLQMTSRQHSMNGRVISHSCLKPPTFPQKDGMPAL